MRLKYNLSNVSTKKTVFWNMAGSMCNAANTVLMTMVITRICGAATAGIYTLALAVAEMLGPISTFQVRNYQASDVKKIYNFHEYLYARYISLLLTFVISIGWIFFHGYSFEKALVIVFCTIFKLVEGYEDVYHGLLQVNNRLDIAGKVFALRIIFATILFIVILIATKNMIISYLIYIIFSVVWTIFATIPCANNFITQESTLWNNIIKLLKDCLPLCITQFLIAYILSCPKYALDKYYTAQTQTYFSTIFMPASIVNLFTLIIYRMYITKMATDWNNGNLKSFLKYTKQIILATLTVGIASLIVGWTFGLPILSCFYGLSEILDYRTALMIILVGGTFNALTGWFNTIFTIIRKQNIILYINLSVFILSLIIVNPMVKHLQINGAALGYMIVMLLLCIIQIFVFLYHISHINIKQKD